MPNIDTLSLDEKVILEAVREGKKLRYSEIIVKIQDGKAVDLELRHKIKL